MNIHPDRIAHGLVGIFIAVFAYFFKDSVVQQTPIQEWMVWILIVLSSIYGGWFFLTCGMSHSPNPWDQEPKTPLDKSINER